jgi:hypothetical protein
MNDPNPDDPNNTPPGDTPPGGDTPPSDTPPNDPNALPEWARKAIEKANREAAAARTKLKEAADAAERAKLTDEERRTAELDEARSKASTAEKRAQETALQLSVERQARKLGIVDEDAAFRLLDTAAVEFDENGKPSNVEALLKTLTESRPWLLGDGKAACCHQSNAWRHHQSGHLYPGE